MKMTMNNMLKANEKIYIKSYAAYTTEDIFGSGEVGNTCCAWTSSDNPVKGRYSTIVDALKAVCDVNYFDYIPANCYNVGMDMPEEAGRFDISVMVDYNNYEATEYDIEEWKAGRKRLWSCQIVVYLGVCAERDLTPEEVAA